MNGDWPAPRPTSTAQLAATIRMLEAVDDLRRDVDALRGEVGPRRGFGISGAAIRVAAESGVLIAVAAVAGAGHFRPLLIVALMGAALLAVVVAEWLASRAAYVPPVFGFAQARPVVVPYPHAEPEPPLEAPLESDPWERGFVAEVEPLRS
jgi:hypothetical protein